jgi:hypothetical protein
MDIEGPQSIDLAPQEAADLLHDETSRAAAELEDGGLQVAVDGFIRALGLGLQLGPAATEQVLAAILVACRQYAVWEGGVCAGTALADASKVFSTLGPAVVDLVAQVQRAGALPGTRVMEAWADLVSELGTVIGQLGIALTIPSKHRASMVASVRTRAVLLDDATAGRFALVAWLEEVSGASD